MSTPGDLLFHIRAHRLDLCFELAQRLMDRLAAAATVVDEVHGFRSFDERDLLGFVDGTENPEGASALRRGHDHRRGSGVRRRQLRDRPEVCARPEPPGMRCRSRNRSGRSAAPSSTDIELPDDVKPANSHVALNTIVDENGVQRRSCRFNMPFGRVGAGEFGTYFIGYAKTRTSSSRC